MTSPVSDPNQKDDVMIRSYTFQEYVALVTSFHGFAAPGVLIGGFMIDLAYRSLPEGGVFDALCETSKCLPDAIQLLTPCTTGNGWLTVVNTGRYAFSLYDKKTGEGVRVFIDASKIDKWSEIKNWYLKLKPKKEQDDQLLMTQIRQARADICEIRPVTIAPRFVEKRHRKGFVICPHCGEAYPVDDGPLCLGCRDPLWSISDDSRV